MSEMQTGGPSVRVVSSEDGRVAVYIVDERPVAIIRLL